jgi:eukaryotic-like serine/threonine-protein kinase
MSSRPPGESWPDPLALSPEVESLLLELLESAPADPKGFLERRCDDAGVRDQVWQLYRQDRSAKARFQSDCDRLGSLLAEPASGATIAVDRIGPWKMCELLGRGGMSAVYRAERDDGLYEQTAAIKLLPSGPIIESLIRRFRSERNILASLEHPNLARLLDGGITEQGLPYFVMEFVDGEPIDQWCNSRSLTIDERLALFEQVMDVVQYAHRNLVVHRDLKPSNILVTDSGQVKLLDFGIAKMLDADRHCAEATELTRMGGRPFTPAWASPEQVAGAAITTASDVYSLGVLLYRLLAGVSPYRVASENSLEVQRAIADQAILPPSVMVPGIEDEAVFRQRNTTRARLVRRLQGDLDNINLYCLRKEPERRYLTVEQLATDLLRHRQNLPVRARPDQFSYRAGRFFRRHWIGASATLVLFLSVVAGLAGTTWQARLAEAEARQAQSAHAFIRALLSAADPYRGVGFDMSPSELLEHASQSMGLGKLDPKSKLQVLLITGQMYSRLSQFESAIALLRPAWEIVETTSGIEPRLRAELLLELAIVEYNAGSLETAEAFINESRSTLESIVGPEHPDLVPVIVEQGIILQELGEYQLALEQLEYALGLLKGVPDPPAIPMATTLRTIGYLHEKMTRFEAAIPYYHQAIDAAAAYLPDDHLHLAGLNNDLGRVHFWLRGYDQAVTYLLNGLEVRQAKLGPEDRSIGASHHNIGVSLYALGNAHAGAEHLEEAVRIYALASGEDNWLTARGQWSLAMILDALGQHQRSDLLFSRSLDTMERFYGPNHRDPVRLLMARAFVLNQRGAFADAQSVAEDALNRIEHLDEQQVEFRQTTRSRLAVSLAGQGRLEQAASLAAKLCGEYQPELPDLITAYTPPCEYASTVLLPERETAAWIRDQTGQ